MAALDGVVVSTPPVVALGTLAGLLVVTSTASSSSSLHAAR